MFNVLEVPGGANIEFESIRNIKCLRNQNLKTIPCFEKSRVFTEKKECMFHEPTALGTG